MPISMSKLNFGSFSCDLKFHVKSLAARTRHPHLLRLLQTNWVHNTNDCKFNGHVIAVDIYHDHMITLDAQDIEIIEMLPGESRDA